MSLFTTQRPPPKIVYPENDGLPMSDNTLQYENIVTIKGGFDDLYRDNPNVFVAGNLLWYPIEGNNTIRFAPDTLVAFGRPKGFRSSYRQWEEAGIAPQVVWEVLSPGNRPGEMQKKFAFYEKYGVDEYYVYDPDRGLFSAWKRQGDVLVEIENPIGWTSPLLGVRFEMNGTELVIIRPDGRQFETFAETCQQLDQARELAESEFHRAELELERAEAERERAEAEHRWAEAEHKRAEAEHKRAEAERIKVERLAAQLRAAGFEPQI